HPRPIPSLPTRRSSDLRHRATATAASGRVAPSRLTIDKDENLPILDTLIVGNALAGGAANDRGATRRRHGRDRGQVDRLTLGNLDIERVGLRALKVERDPIVPAPRVVVGVVLGGERGDQFAAVYIERNRLREDRYRGRFSCRV